MHSDLLLHEVENYHCLKKEEEEEIKKKKEKEKETIHMTKTMVFKTIKPGLS